MSLPAVLALVMVVVVVPLNWYVTITLWRLYRRMAEVRVLRERAIVSTAISVLMTVFALVFLNNDLVPPLISFEETKNITRLAMVLVGIIPASYWLWLYRGR